MKKRRLLILFTAVLILSACARPSAPPQDTTPTPPSIQTTKTPLELLTEAVTNTKKAGTYTVQYGTITTTGDDKRETLRSQAVSPDQPLDWDALFTQVPDFPTNKNLLSDFCNKSICAIPSNTGTIRYELTGLTDTELSALLYGQFADTPNDISTIAIEVDASNRFTRLELVSELDEQNTVTIFLSVLFSA